MPYAVPSMGVLSKLGFGSANPVTEEYEFNECSIAAHPTIIETDGIRGTRDHVSENVVASVIAVGGPWTIKPTNTVITNWMARILGGATAGGITPVAETVPTFYATLDRLVKVFTYAGCKVNKATFTSEQGQNLAMTLDIQGQTETIANAGTFPVLTEVNEPPYIHFAGTFTFNGVARNVRRVTVEIDNHLVLDRFLNSQTRTALPEMDRTTTVTIEAPFTSDEIDLYTQAVQPGVAGSCAWVTTGHTFTLNFGALQQVFPTPAVPGKQEIVSAITFTARSLSTTKSVSSTQT